MSRLTEVLRRLFGSKGRNDSPDLAESSDPDWLQKMGVPLFRSRSDLESYVNREIARTIPDGWAVHQYPFEGGRPAWTIFRDRPDPACSTDYDYIVQVPESLECVILTHGNTDAGMLGLHHALQSALVIDCVMLREFSLGECLTYLFEHCEPNERNAT